LTPLLESVTIAQAALLAAIGEALLNLYYVATVFPIVGAPLSNYLSIVLGGMVPSIVWAAFFLVVHRDRNGRANPVSVRTVAWITLVFGIGFQTAFIYIPFELSVLSWTPLAWFHRVAGWLILVGWVFLLLNLTWTPDRPWTRRVAMAMLILSAPSALEEAYNGTWNNRGMLFWNDYPLEALWRVVTIPAIRIFYVLSQILFLWTIWRNPQRRGPIETLSAHLAP
jgi:hypothetical protein